MRVEVDERRARPRGTATRALELARRPLRVAEPARILVRLPNWVGDVVMATPALAALRARWPRAEIVVEGRPFLRGLLDGLSCVDDFLPDAARGLGPTLARARALRERRFDLALLLPDSPRAALGPFLAGIPERVGYARDPLRRFCLTRALPPPREHGQRVPIPMVERYLELTRALGCPEPQGEPRTALVVDAASRTRIATLLATAGVPTAPGAPGLFVGAPGAHFGSSKLYPPASFAAACDGIHARLGLHTVLAPAPSEVELAADIAARMTTPVAVLREPPTTLAELKALIERAALVLSNDTGPRHMAVALGVPVVVTMGPTDPRHTASQLEHQRVLREDVDCSPCHLKTCPIDHRCMTRLAPARVVSAAAELLAAAPAGRAAAGQGSGPASARDAGRPPGAGAHP